MEFQNQNPLAPLFILKKFAPEKLQESIQFLINEILLSADINAFTEKIRALVDATLMAMDESDGRYRYLLNLYTEKIIDFDTFFEKVPGDYKYGIYVFKIYLKEEKDIKFINLKPFLEEISLQDLLSRVPENQKESLLKEILKNYGDLENKPAFVRLFLEIYNTNIPNDEIKDGLKEVFKGLTTEEKIFFLNKTPEYLSEYIDIFGKEELIPLIKRMHMIFSYEDRTTFNPLIQLLSSEEKISHFTELISNQPNLAIPFMHEKRGIMALIGTGEEVLTLDEVKKVMENLKEKEEEQPYLYIFKLYKEQLKSSK